MEESDMGYMRTGSITLHSFPRTVYQGTTTIFEIGKPEITYYESEPRYKNWPRDCSLVYDFKIVLNRTAQREIGDKLRAWMQENIHEYDPCVEGKNGTYILKTPEDVALYKLVWM